MASAGLDRFVWGVAVLKLLTSYKYLVKKRKLILIYISEDIS